MTAKELYIMVAETIIQLMEWVIKCVEEESYINLVIEGGVVRELAPGEQPGPEPIPEPARKGIVTANRLNVRDEPSARAAKVGLLQAGTEVEILDVAERDNELWYQVGEGLWAKEKGWAAAKYHGYTFIEEQ